MSTLRRRGLAAAAVVALPFTALTAAPAQADAYQSLWDTAWNDHDLDGLSNAREAELGTDPQDPDTDDDGLSDSHELRGVGTARVTDSEGAPAPLRLVPSDPLRADTDGDGLTDAQENQHYTDPTVADTDGDGLSDYQEALEFKDEHGSATVNPWRADTDKDGVNDGDEIAAGTKPDISDLPADSYEAYRRIYNDHDADGLSNDGERYSYYSDLSGELDSDSDDDGLNDGVDRLGYGNADWQVDSRSSATRASNPDTDGDGLSDGQEISLGTNGAAADSDGDGFTDAQEGYFLAPGMDWLDRPLVIHVDPLNPDQNNNGVLDGQEFDLQWLTRA